MPLMLHIPTTQFSLCMCIILVVLGQMTYESYAKIIQSSFANNSQELERNQMSNNGKMVK